MGLVELDKLKDSLSGFYNREALSEYLYNQTIIARSHKKIFSLIMLDIDHFKLINDRYGHLAGDEGLKFFASILNACLRGEYFVARYGGDEFVIILSDRDTVESLKLAKSIRSQLNRKPFIYSEKSIFIKASAGIATFPSDARDGPQLLKKADEALYHAKKKGRNKIVIAKNFHTIGDEIKPLKLLKKFLLIATIGLFFYYMFYFGRLINFQNLYNKVIINSNYFYHKLKYNYNYCRVELSDGSKFQGWIAREDNHLIYLLKDKSNFEVIKIPKEKIIIYIKERK